MEGGENTLVLLSGGMDSTIAFFYRLHIAQLERGRVHTLSFTYGQRHTREVHRVPIIRSVAQRTGYANVIGEHRVVPITLAVPRFAGSLVGGSPVMQYRDVAQAHAEGDADNSFVPYRNLVMLSIAAMHAFKLGAHVITTGLRGGFADCTKEFEQRVQDLLNYTVPDYPIKIETPTHISRAACIRLADGLPGCMQALAYTHTCFNNARVPCGHCLPCLKRAEGFAEAGIADPLLTRLEQNMEDSDANE